MIHLDVDDGELQRRLLARAESQGRDDDTPDGIARRLEVFRTTTAPVVELYRERGVLLAVDGALTARRDHADDPRGAQRRGRPLTAAAP